MDRQKEECGIDKIAWRRPIDPPEISGQKHFGGKLVREAGVN
jgi:hypothetical protein